MPGRPSAPEKRRASSASTEARELSRSMVEDRPDPGPMTRSGMPLVVTMISICAARFDSVRNFIRGSRIRRTNSPRVMLSSLRFEREGSRNGIDSRTTFAVGMLRPPR